MNRQITLAARPKGFPKQSDFRLVQTPIPRPGAGEFLVQGLYLSVDPYMRGRMSEAESYAAPIRLGDTIVGESVGRVLESNHERFPVGSYVSGMFGWQEYATSNGQGVRRLDPQVAPISTALHVLGMPGLTAYFGLFDVCRPRAGETVVISAAAGAVGSVVGQLAKQAGCRTVGVAGSDKKINFVTDELGFDAGFNYKTTEDYLAAYKELCPAGIDVFFDNVGGPLSDAVFPCLRPHARIAICGQISLYNASRTEQGPRLLWHLIVKRATIQGFLVTDYAARFREALAQLSDWYQQGKLKYRERVTQGIENAPMAFMEMMQGANIGKQLVRLADDPG